MAPLTRRASGTSVPTSPALAPEKSISTENGGSPKPVKRPRVTSTVKTPTKKSKIVPVTPNPAPAFSNPPKPEPLLPSLSVDDTSHIVVRPTLSFSYKEAREHLVKVDPRFEFLMDRLVCKPFEEQEDDLNPFRALCSSILGQQISWLAARSITYKFIRLVGTSEAHSALPEKPEPSAITSLTANLFPSPAQVAACPMTTLRAAGLSQRKAEYVQDLAQRFADGRLSAPKLMDMTDEEVMKELTEVRGIGKWTVEMFMIFTLRRPNVLPCGDLGVQKGLVRWLTMVNPSIHVRKLPETPKPTATTANSGNAVSTPVRNDALQATPSLATVEESAILETPQSAKVSVPSTPRSSTPPPRNSGLPADYPSTPLPSSMKAVVDAPLLTPRTTAEAVLPPYPECRTLPDRKALSARLTKKIKGNIYLSPTEMEELTESWKPYRSIGVWYLWSLSDADTDM